MLIDLSGCGAAQSASSTRHEQVLRSSLGSLGYGEMGDRYPESANALDQVDGNVRSLMQHVVNNVDGPENGQNCYDSPGTTSKIIRRTTPPFSCAQTNRSLLSPPPFFSSAIRPRSQWVSPDMLVDLL